MKLLITGICGFVGSYLARWFRERNASWEIIGVDNFIRPGSETNRAALRSCGINVQHGDARNVSDFENLPPVDWVIDAAANPSVLAELVSLQFNHSPTNDPPIFNVGGGADNAMSSAQLTSWCGGRFGKRDIESDSTPRPFDVPWLVMDNRQTAAEFKWSPKRKLASILEEIATRAEQNPNSLDLSAP